MHVRRTEDKILFIFSSTETQTDELDALMASGKPPTGSAPAIAHTPSTPHHDGDDEDPFSHPMDTDVMLDFLCSNYTQTCAGNYT